MTELCMCMGHVSMMGTIIGQTGSRIVRRAI